jgi:hypothetical protein
MTKYEKNVLTAKSNLLSLIALWTVSFLGPLHLCQLLTLTLIQLHMKHKDPNEEDTSDAHEKNINTLGKNTVV